MARPYRIQFENALYRAEIRGAEGLGLFAKPVDARKFLEILAASLKKHEVILHAFVLLADDADLLVETPKGNLSSFLQGMQTAYAQYYRWAYDHQGPLVRDRFRSKVVDKASALLELSAFLHARPAREAAGRRTPAQRQALLGKQVFSSYPTYAGLNPLPFVHTKDVLLAMGSPAGTRQKRYLDRVALRVIEPDETLAGMLEASATAIGDAKFLEDIHKQHAKFQAGRKPGNWKLYGQRSKEVSRAQILEATAQAFGVDKDVFFEQRKNVLHRPVLSYLLYRHAGMSQFEIAKYLRLTSNAAVSLQITRYLNALPGNPELAKLVDKIEKSFA